MSKRSNPPFERRSVYPGIDPQPKVKLGRGGRRKRRARAVQERPAPYNWGAIRERLLAALAVPPIWRGVLP